MSCNGSTENGNGDSTTRSNKRKPSNNSQSSSNARQQQQEPSATLWEHFVLHKASESKLRIFDLTIEDEKPKPAKMSALATATANLMGMLGEQRSGSASSLLSDNSATSITTTTTPTETAGAKPKALTADAKPAATAAAAATADAPLQQTGSLPPAFLASLASVHSLSQNTTSTATNASKPANGDNKESQLPPGDEKFFGRPQELALNPSIRRFDAARQEALIRDAFQQPDPFGDSGGILGGERSTWSKHRLLAEILGGAFGSEDMVMVSGGLGEGDGRCEVCDAAAAAGEEKEVVG